MANVVKQFRNMNAFFDGINYAGQVDEFHPPQLEVMTEPYKSGGMDVPVLLDMGMEPLEGRLIINGYEQSAFAGFGLADAKATTMRVLGGLEDYDGTTSSVEWIMTGNVTTLGMGRIRGRGETPRTMISIACVEYQIIQAGITIIDIDVLNMTRLINGVDRLAELRAAIGL
jgi:P2 family phage contractile tail tube protein